MADTTVAIPSTSKIVSKIDNDSKFVKYTPIGAWLREENGAIFEAGILDYAKINDNGEEEPSVLLMKMDPNFLTADEANIVRRRLLFDEDGSDRKLTKLIELYCRLEDEKNCEENYRLFKEIVENCESLRFLGQRTVLAIQTNLKASKYWRDMNDKIKVEMDDLRHLMSGYKKKKADREKLQKMCAEKKRIAKSLKETPAREELEKEIARLREEINALKVREEELDGLAKERKVYAQHIIELVKSLDSTDIDKMMHAIVEIDKNFTDKVVDKLL